MIPKIEQLTYSYVGNGIINISATLTIYADDGTTILHQKGISTTTNLNDTALNADGVPNWKANAIARLQAQAQEIIDAYKQIMGTISSGYPTAATPQEILDALAQDVESGIVA